MSKTPGTSPKYHKNSTEFRLLQSLDDEFNPNLGGDIIKSPRKISDGTEKYKKTFIETIKAHPKIAYSPTVTKHKLYEVDRNHSAPTSPHFKHHDKQLKILNTLVTSENINQLDASNNSFMMIAAKKGNIKKIEQLLQLNPDLNIQNIKSESALVIALQHNHLDIAKLLITSGAKIGSMTVKDKSIPILVNMVTENKYAFVKLILENQVNLILPQEQKALAVIKACKKNYCAALTQLIKYDSTIFKGAEIFTQNEKVVHLVKIGRLADFLYTFPGLDKVKINPNFSELKLDRDDYNIFFRRTSHKLNQDGITSAESIKEFFNKYISLYHSMLIDYGGEDFYSYFDTHFQKIINSPEAKALDQQITLTKKIIANLDYPETALDMMVKNNHHIFAVDHNNLRHSTQLKCYKLKEAYEFCKILDKLIENYDQEEYIKRFKIAITDYAAVTALARKFPLVKQKLIELAENGVNPNIFDNLNKIVMTLVKSDSQNVVIELSGKMPTTAYSSSEDSKVVIELSGETPTTAYSSSEDSIDINDYL